MAKKSKAKKAKPPKRKDEPADWQEAHSPTVDYTVRGDVRHGIHEEAGDPQAGPC